MSNTMNTSKNINRYQLFHIDGGSLFLAIAYIAPAIPFFNILKYRGREDP